jgi:hypothetical protein
LIFRSDLLIEKNLASGMFAPGRPALTLPCAAPARGEEQNGVKKRAVLIFLKKRYARLMKKP